MNKLIELIEKGNLSKDSRNKYLVSDSGWLAAGYLLSSSSSNILIAYVPTLGIPLVCGNIFDDPYNYSMGILAFFVGDNGWAL